MYLKRLYLNKPQTKATKNRLTCITWPDLNLISNQPVEHDTPQGNYFRWIIYMKKMLDSDWLRAVQFFFNSAEMS